MAEVISITRPSDIEHRRAFAPRLRSLADGIATVSALGMELSEQIAAPWAFHWIVDGVEREVAALARTMSAKRAPAGSTELEYAIGGLKGAAGALATVARTSLRRRETRRLAWAVARFVEDAERADAAFYATWFPRAAA